MASVTVDSTAAALDLSAYGDKGERGQTVVLQNLSDNDIYFDIDNPDVDATSGVQISAGGYWEMVTLLNQTIYVVASADDSDLRFVVIG